MLRKEKNKLRIGHQRKQPSAKRLRLDEDAIRKPKRCPRDDQSWERSIQVKRKNAEDERIEEETTNKARRVYDNRKYMTRNEDPLQSEINNTECLLDPPMMLQVPTILTQCDPSVTSVPVSAPGLTKPPPCVRIIVEAPPKNNEPL